MSRYRRTYVPGGTYFFTVVTYKRQRLFADERARTILRDVIEETRKNHPFEIIAMCLLPDHLHCIWTLPRGDKQYSRRWARIKAAFSRRYRQTACDESHPTQSASRKRRGLRPVWQKRFWEHMIRDEADFRRHVDYVHYNPVKHGLVARAADWKWSTFGRYVKEGIYPADWGGGGIEAMPVLETARE